MLIINQTLITTCFTINLFQEVDIPNVDISYVYRTIDIEMKFILVLCTSKKWFSKFYIICLYNKPIIHGRLTSFQALKHMINIVYLLSSKKKNTHIFKAFW